MKDTNRRMNDALRGGRSGLSSAHRDRLLRQQTRAAGDTPEDKAAAASTAAARVGFAHPEVARHFVPEGADPDRAFSDLRQTNPEMFTGPAPIDGGGGGSATGGGADGGGGTGGDIAPAPSMNDLLRAASGHGGKTEVYSLGGKSDRLPRER